MNDLELVTSDGHRLAADRADPPDGATIRGALVLCHPHPLYGGNRFNPVVAALFDRAPQAGLVTLRFDFRAAHDDGIGERLDLLAALDALGDVPGLRVVAGYSFGAQVALSVAGAPLDALVVIAPPVTAASPPPPIPTFVLAPRHDQFFAYDQTAAIVAGWRAAGAPAEIEPVESADHFLAGQAATVAERTLTWISGQRPIAGE